MYDSVTESFEDALYEWTAAGGLNLLVANGMAMPGESGNVFRHISSLNINESAIVFQGEDVSGTGAVEFEGIYSVVEGKIARIVDTQFNNDGSGLLDVQLFKSSVAGNYVAYLARFSILIRRDRDVQIATLP